MIMTRPLNLQTYWTGTKKGFNFHPLSRNKQIFIFTIENKQIYKNVVLIVFVTHCIFQKLVLRISAVRIVTHAE